MKWTRMWWLLLLALAAVPVCIWAGSAGHVVGAEPTPLPTGKFIRPVGNQTDVGSYPANMALSPDGAYVIVTDTGFREQLSVLDSRTGSLVSKLEFSASHVGPKHGLYYGIACTVRDGKTIVYASRGSEGTVSVCELSADGQLSSIGEWRAFEKRSSHEPVVAGLATSADGKRLYALDNNTCEETHMKGLLSVIDTSTGAVIRRISVPGFPLSVVSMPSAGRDLVYISSERDGEVAAVDPDAGKVVKTIPTAVQPTSLLADSERHRLFVSNSDSDTVSVIDTLRNRVASTILVRPPEMRGLPGATPLGSALSADGSRLFVTLADLNAVAVVDVHSGTVVGYVSTGWYPTAACLNREGTRLFVANAKGVAERTPNDKLGGPDGRWGHYIQNLLEGTVSTVDVSGVLSNLPALSEEALTNNRLEVSNGDPPFKNPGIRHVVYIVKENRTYDQVLGDDPKGNGDPNICLFPKDVTPNQHALADRFVLLDNFYCCAEVSADGWNWSTSGMANEYTSRNTPYNYSGRGRNYDFEGENNDVAPNLRGLHDVAEAPGGYIWDLVGKHGLSYRNYGFFIRPTKAGDREEPVERALQGHTDASFREFDLAYCDSEAFQKYGLRPPHGMERYGEHAATSRFAEWKTEFDEFVRAGDMPRFMTLRLPRDHTEGSTAGVSSARAMVADNDYAVGEVVDAISHSRFWKSTLICIVEDDAQGGYDHVDCHRSTAYLVSPFVNPGAVDSHFYNTDSVLRTMELALSLPPMNGYDSVAPVFDVFSDLPLNLAPYTAVLPAKAIVGQINGSHAYRSADSKRLIQRLHEESAADEQLNDILWGSIKGAHVPRPVVRNAVRSE